MCTKPSPTGHEWFEFQNTHSHHNNIVQPAAGRTQYILYIYTILYTMDSTGPCGELAPHPATRCIIIICGTSSIGT